MSIYATLWNIQVSIMVPATKPTMEFELSKERGYREIEWRWVEVYAQSVPPHIGHPSSYPDGDPYADFLPPVVEHDPEDLEAIFPARAVVILDEDHDEKDGQRYVNPLMVLTGVEYESMKFGELLGRIEEAVQDRFDAELKSKDAPCTTPPSAAAASERGGKDAAV